VKILDRYILSTFVKTFLSVFTILYFIFILQGVWVFIGELAGKDLDVMTIVKFLFFYSPKMISMVLPLSVLLSSIMTFGDFSENYEFAAMKSAGISLQRAMRYLIFFIAGLTLLSFWFVNNVAPKSEYKFVNMRKDILQTKPAMAIAAGQFNDVGNINIKVEKKEGNKGELLDKVTMHIKSNVGFINKTVIKADRGILETDDASNLLKLHLFDGHYYEDVATKTRAQAEKSPFAKASFKKYTINIDMGQFNTEEENKSEISNTANMMSVKQLGYTIDSLRTNFQKESVSQQDNLMLRSETVLNEEIYKNQVVVTPKGDSLFGGKTRNQKLQIYRNASSTAENIGFTAHNNESINQERLKNINRHEHTKHEKFALAFSCILMFFIGAPLGAIIRKGGLGLPMIFAVLIFISYHFINTFGRKLAQENGIPGSMGAWLGAMVLLPLAISFTSKATRDRGINSVDNMFYHVKVFFKKVFKKKSKQHV